MPTLDSEIPEILIIAQNHFAQADSVTT